MIELIKRLKQLSCKHEDAALLRWHWLHDPDYALRHVEAEYRCHICGKVFYQHYYGKEARDWAFVMGEHKMSHLAKEGATK